MFRYIVALLMVSLYSKSSGAPTSGSTTDLSVLLTHLASTCENQFLRTQIASKVKECHVLVPPYDEKKFQCMLFYDMSNQLCTAVAASKLAVTDDYTAQIQKEQNVQQLCSNTKDWSFSQLGDVYKKYVSVVFNDSIRCARVCSEDNTDILNVESNFYCKYYKWGTEMLKTHVITAPTQSGSAVGEAVHLPANIDMVTKKPALPVDSSAPSSPDASAKNPVVVPKPLTWADTGVSHSAVADPSVATSEKVKPDTDNVDTNPGLSNSGQQSNNAGAPAPTSNPVKLDTSGDNKGVVDTNTAPLQDGTQNNQVSQIEPDQIQETASDVNKNSKPKGEETDSKQKKEESSIHLPNNQVDKPNQNVMVDPDEYQNELDSDEVRGGLSDNQGGDDGDDGSLGDIDPKADKSKVDNNKKDELAIPQFNVNDISQKEYYPSDGFPEEDDHFFSFFLTAIIMVVLLYVLYHNKSKVSKVIMGLIVEGRQPGRRRNSRGHAYKRLDTLEQAMSANSTAPPSKIIY